nr:hypothetical protein [Tanacetum cinerariifolium]
SPQQNGVVERQNHTLIKAARTMLIYVKALLFLWAKAVAIACHTQNLGALCYPTNDSDNLGKLQPKDDNGIFIVYALINKAVQIYNRPTRQIIETIDVDFDELTTMASEYRSSEPTFYEMTPATISSGLVPNPPSSTPFVPPSRIDWDLLFQPLFDELLTPPPNVDFPAPEVIDLVAKVVAPKHVASTSLPFSTTVDQDASSPIEPKNFKQAMIKPSWIDAMQEEIHEFKRLEVWELVSYPGKVLLIKLKWIYKVKIDEFGGVLKNKARLAAQGFSQKEGIDFEESFQGIIFTG